MSQLIRSVLVVLAVGLGGCATMSTLDTASGGTEVRVYEKTYDEVWKAAVRAMSSNLTIVEVNKNAGVIKSEARAGMATWGEVVGLFVTPTPSGKPGYVIRVVSMKRSTMQITGQDWEPGVAAILRAELEV